ncbi:cyclase family protein [soil metagenome]
MTVTLAEQLAKAKVYDLEQPRFRGMPIHPAHQPGYFYALHRRHADNYRPQSSGSRSSASGMLSMMEHSGTHIDALCHQACGLELFGGVPVAAVESAIGFSQLGIETVPPLLTRGVLLDVAGCKNQEMLPPHYGITADDLQACARSQQVTVKAGDVLLVRTGFAQIWLDEPAYLEAAGVAKSGTIWAADQQVVAVGADNMAWDVIPERDPESGSTLFAHLHLLTKKGIYILENLNLESLASERCYEFAFVGIPLKFQGATGSPIRPLALV